MINLIKDKITINQEVDQKIRKYKIVILIKIKKSLRNLNFHLILILNKCIIKNKNKEIKCIFKNIKIK